MDYATAAIRHARYNEFGTIDLELFRKREHLDEEGKWIPFTADPTDDEEHGRLLYARAAAELAVEAYVLPAVEELRENALTSQENIAEAIIDLDPSKEDEIMAWVLENKVPATARNVFREMRPKKKIRVLRDDIVARDADWIEDFLAAYGINTPEAVDAVFNIEVQE